MSDFKVIDKVGMPHVLSFVVGKLGSFDTSCVEWVKLLPLNRSVLLHGECRFPAPGQLTGGFRRGYRIRASVNIEMCPPFSFTHWGRHYSEGEPHEWRSKETDYHFFDLEECAVHTLAHECFHFLSDSGQVDEKNYEANANWWADQWLKEYRSNY